MTRTWLSVTVELLGGRGEQFWPYPGRVFAVGPTHSFQDLADAINMAFARWDRSRVFFFTLDDGRTMEDAAMTSQIVASNVAPGAEFQFTFDVGDSWIHRCQIAEKGIDPAEELGRVPDLPQPYQGWGSIPDQYGRDRADDWSTSRGPGRPRQPHPMLLHMWPATKTVSELDMAKVWGALSDGDGEGFVAAVTDCNIDDVLQQVGSHLPPLLLQDRPGLEPVTQLFINRLHERGWEGDAELAEDLLALLHGGSSPGRMIPVDLDMLSHELEGDPNTSMGGLLDLETGETWGREFLYDMGSEMDIDTEEDPDRWLSFGCQGSREGWQDMAIFSERQMDTALRQRLEMAIEGRGAFRRFRDVVYQEDIVEEWEFFSLERRMGRARAFLAERGFRVRDPGAASPPGTQPDRPH